MPAALLSSRGEEVETEIRSADLSPATKGTGRETGEERLMILLCTVGEVVVPMFPMMHAIVHRFSFSPIKNNSCVFIDFDCCYVIMKMIDEVMSA